MNLANSMKLSKLHRFYKYCLIGLVLITRLVNVDAQTVVHSLSELKTYLDDDNVNVTMAPGTYTITAASANPTIVGSAPYTSAVLLYFSGNNSTFDFTGVTIEIETAVLQSISGVMDIWEINVVGNNTVLKNLTMLDDGSVYDKPKIRTTNIVVDGSGNTIEGFNMTIKGSTPYGYGDAFGKGSDNIISHTKHCGILLRGDSPYAKNCTLNHMAYGHAMFLQGAVDALIEGCTIIGEVRSTDEMLAEEGTGSAADKVDFMGIWGYRLPPGFMMSTGEEGIRAYTAGATVIDGVSYGRNTTNVTVRNCTIKFMRFGVNLGHASGTRIVTGCTTVGCELGISADDMTGSTVDVSYGPLAVGGANNETKDITITQLLEPYNGAGRAAYICGSGNDITIRCDQANVDQSLKVVVSGGYNTIGFQPGTKYDYQNIYSGSNNKIQNLTFYPIVLGENSSNNTGVSGGMVIDLGTNNNIVQIALPVLEVEAEEYNAMSGITTESSTDEGAGENVNSIDAGDWMEYEIDVPYSGTYSFDYRVSNTSVGSSFTLSSDDEELEVVTFENAEDSWTTVRSSSPIFFNKGLHTIKITSKNADWKINRMSLLLECTEVPIVPYVENLTATGASLQKEQTTDLIIFPGNNANLAPEPAAGGTWNWIGPNGFSSDQRVVNFNNIQKDQSGEYTVTYTNQCGIQTADTFHVNVQDSLYIEAEQYSEMSGITVETTSDISGESNITSIVSGDWLEYEIDVPFSGLYSFSYRVASEMASSEFDVSVNDEMLDQVTFERSGGLQIWKTVSSGSILKLNAGVQKLRITSNSEAWNLNWIKLKVIQTILPCNLPYEEEGFRIYNTAFNWTSGALDISCENELDLHVNIQSLLNFADGDYLNIYYKLDAGEKITLAEFIGKDTDPMVTATNLSGKTLEIIIESNVGKAGIYDVKNILLLKSSDPFARIEAEDFDEADGTRAESTSDAGGGENVGFITNGNWLMYKNLYLSGVHSVNLRLATERSNGSIEIRLNSPTGKKIGTVQFPNTGGWQKWVTISESLENVIGFYDVYLVFKSSADYVGNINWLEFSPTKIEDPSATIELYNSIESIQIYPNPVSKFLNITTNKSESAIIKILNYTGTKVLSAQISNTNNTIDVSSLKPGIYLVYITTNNKIFTKKIIKN